MSCASGYPFWEHAQNLFFYWYEMKEFVAPEIIDEKNISVVCSYCCKLIRVSESWKKGHSNPMHDDSAQLSHGICPECLLENFPNEYLTIQRDNRLRIKKTYSAKHCEVTEIAVK